MNLATVSIRRPVFATMLIAAIMVFGLISYPKVGVDLMPDVDLPYVTIQVVYPGTDPLTMEREVAEPIEESVNSLGGIRSLRSYNMESATQVVIEFELEVNGDQAVQDVRDRVARIQSELPDGADPPIIQKFDIGSAPIIYLALHGDVPIKKLTHIADKTVKQRLERVRGVGSIDLLGGRDREIQVITDLDKLSGLGLTVQDVAQTIAAQNLDVPAGSFEQGQRELTVKTKGQLQSAEEISNIILPTLAVSPGQSPAQASAQPVVRVGDIAQVVDGIQEASSSSRFDGKTAVTLAIRKQSGSNTVELAHSVRREIAALQPTLARDHLKLDVATDNSIYIERSIEDVEFDLVFGGILAVVVIFFFLTNIRATLISALALPTSVIATFAFVYWMGFTFNNLTMLALSIAIGVLIDDAIVVMENIHRHLEDGKPAFRAASEATSEIFLAVLSMTSSILAVFVPVAVMKGIIGRFFMQFGLTVSFAVAMSMLVSFTLTPMLSSRLLHAHDTEGRLARATDAVMGWFERVYGKIVRWSLGHRIATLGVAALALVASGMLVSRVPTEFFPKEDRNQFQVSVELPNGSSLEATTRYVEKLAEDVRRSGFGVDHVLTTVGGGQQAQINKGDIQVKLVPSTERKFGQHQIMTWFRERYSKLANVMVTVSEINNMGGGPAQTIQYLIRGQDMDELVKVSEKMKTELTKVKGFVDVDTTYRGGKPEVTLRVDRERAAAMGVPVAVVAGAIRSLLAGDAVTELIEGTDAYDVTMRLAKGERQRVETLTSMKVRSTSGQLVDLANVVKVDREYGPSKIERFDRQRQITLLANLDGLPLGPAKEKVESLGAQIIPSHMEGRSEGMGRIMAESFGYMGEALILAVVLVYMILAAQFDSFIQPITIMISLPLSVIGAFGALYFSGMTLSMFSMIGIIMLMGLVTKNAILLVDFTNQARQGGAPIKEALIQAGILRLRPILMTTVAMVFGMLPVALALGEGGEARAPMAICVIGGLVTSTMLTLVVVPVVYTLFAALAEGRLVRFFGRKIFGDQSHLVEPQASERNAVS